MLTKKNILIALPTLNEADNIELLILELLEQPEQVDLVIIDDHSLDGTPEIIKKLQSQYPNRISLIERPSKQGLATAYFLAFEYGLAHAREYDYFFQMDADFSHDPSAIGEFIAKINQGADCVLGSRYVQDGEIKNWTTWRRLLSAAGNLYARFWLWLPYKDVTSGYKCFNRRALLALDFKKIKTCGYGFQIEMTQKLHQNKLNIKEIPIVFTDRVHGKSKMTKRIILEAILKVPLMRFL